MTPKFKSGFEEWIWKSALRRNQKMEYETLWLTYVISHKYNPDFILKNGIIIEAKGKFDQNSRRKMAAVKLAHPELDIRFVFQNANNRLSKRGKMTYWQWAEWKRFPWVEGDIPLDWFKEKKFGTS